MCSPHDVIIKACFKSLMFRIICFFALNLTGSKLSFPQSPSCHRTAFTNLNKHKFTVSTKMVTICYSDTHLTIRRWNKLCNSQRRKAALHNLPPSVASPETFTSLLAPRLTCQVIIRRVLTAIVSWAQQIFLSPPVSCRHWTIELNVFCKT
jgi:hypothetical protein